MGGGVVAPPLQELTKRALTTFLGQATVCKEINFCRNLPAEAPKNLL
jgi:hypothetical protein